MDLIHFNKRVNNFMYKLLNLGSDIIYMFGYVKSISYRLKNNELKNSFNGSTCYIIGNGPSLKEMDLSLLSDKIVFTVNKMVNTTAFDILRPQYHCICDRLVINDIFDELEEKISQNDYGTKFLLHRSMYEKFKKYNNTYFIYGTKICISEKLDIDITKNCNVFMNVVPFAIRNAIYMGFTKIILLGCDFSFFANRTNTHFYGQNEIRKETLYQDLSGSAIALLEYKHLYQYCVKHNIELVNCTPKTFLDVIPQGDIYDYLN